MKKKSFISKPFSMVLAFILALFLLANIISSQTISPLYSGVVNENEAAVVAYLKKIKTLPIFPSQLAYYQTIYGPSLAQQVNLQDLQLKYQISRFKKGLQLNPYSRDVLYNLYLLYSDKEDKQMAQEYLRRAQAVDPNLPN